MLLTVRILINHNFVLYNQSIMVWPLTYINHILYAPRADDLATWPLISTGFNYVLMASFNLGWHFFIQEHSKNVSCGYQRHLVPAVHRRWADMWNQDTIVEFRQFVVRWQWFWAHDIESGSKYMPRAQRMDEGVLLDKTCMQTTTFFALEHKAMIDINLTTTARVHKHGIGFHQTECLRIEYLFRCICQWGCYDDEVWLMEQRVEVHKFGTNNCAIISWKKVRNARGCLALCAPSIKLKLNRVKLYTVIFLAASRVNEPFHVEWSQARHHPGTNASQTKYADCGSCEAHPAQPGGAPERRSPIITVHNQLMILVRWQVLIKISTLLSYALDYLFMRFEQSSRSCQQNRYGEFCTGVS